MNLYVRNILETGAVTVTGTADTGFPETRLYDRAISLLWKDTATEAKEIVIDQGGSGNLSVDLLIIERHNFSGCNLQWQYSNDNFVSDIHDAVAGWTQAGNGQIVKALPVAVARRYWRVTMSSMANPKCGEIFMSFGCGFRVAATPPPILSDYDNVRWNKTIGGVERSTKLGNERRARTYSMLLDSTELVSFRSEMDQLDGYSQPFYIQDPEENYWLCRLEAVPRERPDGSNVRTIVSLNLIEVL